MHWRHEQLSLRMALAAATRVKEVLEDEQHDAPRRQTSTPGGRGQES